MEEKSSPKKALKRKRTKPVSKPVVSDSDDSDNEQPDLNGVETTLNVNDDSFLSDGGWSSDDDRELVQKIKSTTKQADKVSYKTRLKQLNWNNIAFKSYSGDECEKRFQNHLKHVRRHRNLNEIVSDIETNIKKFPLKKPLNSYQLFIQDQLTNVKSSGDFSETMKNLATLYKGLSSEERAVYERKAEELRLEYKQNRADFESGNISMTPKTAGAAANNKMKTPFMLYAESKKLEESDYTKLREQYNNLPIDEKYKLVIKAVSEAQDRSEENVSKILNKEEQRIFKGQIKPTPSAYSLYVKDSYNKIKVILDEQQDSKNVFSEIALRWKSLDPKKKKSFMNAAAILKEKAMKEQEAFNERHGVTPQRGKRRKSVFIERPPEDESDHEGKEDETPSKPKKQKTSEYIGSDDETDTKQIQIKLPIKPKATPKLKSPTRMLSPSKLSTPKLDAVPVAKSPVKVTVSQSPVKIQRTKEKEEDTDEDNEKEEKNENEKLELRVKKKRDKKNKKNKLNSESSEYNERSESDAVYSSSSSSTKKKKKEKKEKKEKGEVIEAPGEKPPSDFFNYFVKFIHTGKPHKAQKAIDKLPKKELKQLKAEYNEKVQVYMDRLTVYLKSLPKDEAVEYVAKIKQLEEEEKNDEDSSQEY